MPRDAPDGEPPRGDPNDFRVDDVQFDGSGRERFTFIPAANIGVVLLGISDASGAFESGGPVPPSEYAQHRVDLVWTLPVSGVDRVMLVTAPTPSAWRPPHHVATRLDRYAAIHPTIEGHRAIARGILARLSEWLDALE